jgi:metallophosphoesterase (TIGR00282 family)
LKILFIGDIVGRIGRRIVKEKLNFFVEKYDINFVIANGENATHGKGLIRHHYEELINAGIDCITLCNHYSAKSELAKYIERVDCLIRPINLVKEYPGYGTALFDVDGITIRVTNILGSAFINEEVVSPYSSLLDLLASEEESANIHIIDYHGEATGEKQCFGHVFDGKVSAILGTHTHVQTKDAQILEKGTAYISDVGMCGYKDGVLGFDKESVIAKTIYGKTQKFELPNEGKGVFSAVVIDIDEMTGLANDFFTIYYEE